MRSPIRRSVLALASVAAIVAGITTTALAAPALAATESAPSLNQISATVGSTTAWHRLTVKGTNLDKIARLYVGGVLTTSLTHHAAGSISFSLPPAPLLEASTVRLRYVVKGGKVHHLTGLTYSWHVLSNVDREMDFVFRNWNATSSADYGYFGSNDCANFASQALIARGWVPNSVWEAYSNAFIRSTELRNYLKTTGAIQLTDGQRARVRIGDLVQFDFDHNGDRDHTGIVSRIIHRAGGHISIYFAGHTRDERFRSIDYVITDKAEYPGAAVFYWHPGHQ